MKALTTFVDWFANLGKVEPLTAAQVAAREYEEAQLDLLDAEARKEEAACDVAYLTNRVERLRRAKTQLVETA